MQESSHPGFEKRFFEWVSCRNIKIIRDFFSISPNNQRAEFLFFKPPATRGIVLFAHGTGNDKIFPQVQLFQGLLQAGYAVFTFDLGGHGRHATTLLNLHTGGTLNAAMMTLRQLLRIHDLPARLHLTGYSLGGHLVLDYLCQNPTERDIVSAAVIAVPRQVSLSLLTGLKELRTFVDPVFWRSAAFYGLWDLIPALGPFKRRLYPVRLEGLGRGSLSYMKVVKDIIEQGSIPRPLSLIQKPVLGIFGGRDAIADCEAGHEMIKELPAGSYHCCAERTHFTVLLSEETIATVVRWIVQHNGAGDV